MSRTTAGLSLLLLLGSSVGSPAPDAPSLRFPSEAQVVVLDVVARDGKGRLLEDLRPDELEIFEDGKRCEVLSFRLVRSTPKGVPRSMPTGPSPTPAADSRSAGETAPPTTSAAPTPTRPSLVVLVFDRLDNTTAALARKGARDLLQRSFPADTWFAVFKVHTGVSLLTPFTTDPAVLQSAIDAATRGDADRPRARLAPELPPVKLAPEDSPGAQPATVGPPVPDMRAVAASLSGHERDEALRVRGLDSLYAVLGIAQAMGAVEGRKSIVYFAEAWALKQSLRGAYDAAVSAANRANVAVHVVDARGLKAQRPTSLDEPTPMDALDSVIDKFTAESRGAAGRGSTTPDLAAHGNVSGGTGTRAKPALTQDAEDAENQTFGPRLEMLAQDTGGLAIRSTNDLGAGLSRVAEELGLYYEVVYAPANTANDGSFRRISVKTSRSGVRLRTRTGYFASASQVAKRAAYELPLMDALDAAAPAHDFPLRADVLHFGAKGTQRECVVFVEVPLSEVRFSSGGAGGEYRAQLSLLGYVKDEAGRVAARLSHDWLITGPADREAAARQANGMFKRMLPLSPGRYLLEIAVQDRQSGARSVRRAGFDVPPPGAGLSLGTIARVQRVDAAGASGAADPLRIGDVSLVPALGTPFVARSSPELPLFVGIYPAGTGPVELTFEVHREGKVVARATPALPVPDADGHIAWLGGIPSDALESGTYELTVVARQGEAKAEERTTVTVAAQPPASANSAASPGAAGPESPAAGRTEPRDPALDDVLERAARYVVGYEESFRNIVAEEVYQQHSTQRGPAPIGVAPVVQLADGQWLRTRADIVFVRLAGDVPWGVFRDVFEANGQRVRDREQRLEALLHAPSPSSLAQANRILAESSRYNIGAAHRNLNLPTLPLMFLLPRNQSRFRFELAGKTQLEGRELREVKFTEIARPTLVTSEGRADLPSSGRLWIDPVRGTVVRTSVDFRFEPRRAVANLTTQYRAEQRLAMWVPVEMRESYSDLPGTNRPVFFSETKATARYTNFRAFTVSVGVEASVAPAQEESKAPQQ